MVATAKRDLKPGEVLDGEGGYMVWGKLVPASVSKARNALPLGLASMRLKRPVAQGATVTWDDVDADPKDPTVAVRRAMEANGISGIEYVEIVGARDLAVLERLEGRVLIAVAARVGKTRLIDNIVIAVTPDGGVEETLLF